MSLVPRLLEARFSAHISVGFLLGIVTGELTFVFSVVIPEGVVRSSFICNNLRQIFLRVHLKKRKCCGSLKPIFAVHFPLLKEYPDAI